MGSRSLLCLSFPQCLNKSIPHSASAAGLALALLLPGTAGGAAVLGDLNTVSGLVLGFPSLQGADCPAFVPRANGNPGWKLMRYDRGTKGREARVFPSVQTFNERAEARALPQPWLPLAPEQRCLFFYLPSFPSISLSSLSPPLPLL